MKQTVKMTSQSFYKIFCQFPFCVKSLWSLHSNRVSAISEERDPPSDSPATGGDSVAGGDSPHSGGGETVHHTTHHLHHR